MSAKSLGKGDGMERMKLRKPSKEATTEPPTEREDRFVRQLSIFKIDNFATSKPPEEELKASVQDKEFKKISKEDFEVILKKYGLSLSGKESLKGLIYEKDGKKIKILSSTVSYFPLLKKGRISLIVREID